MIGATIIQSNKTIATKGAYPSFYFKIIIFFSRRQYLLDSFLHVANIELEEFSYANKYNNKLRISIQDQDHSD